MNLQETLIPGMPLNVFDIFKRLSKEFGQTIITVTHDNDFARKSDRILEMVDGKIGALNKLILENDFN